MTPGRIPGTQDFATRSGRGAVAAGGPITISISVRSAIGPFPFSALSGPEQRIGRSPGCTRPSARAENTAWAVAASNNLPDPEAFFVADGELFAATALTRGPWDARSQHAGPPAALVGRAIERCPGVGGHPAERHVGRITYEILAPIPIAPVRVEAEVTRGGQRVDMVEATLSPAGGDPVIRARAWRLLRREIELPPGLASDEQDSPANAAGRPSGEPGAPRLPEELERTSAFFPTSEEVGYQAAMDGRFDRGSFTEIGPAVAWMRPLHPLVAGEQWSPLQRVLVAADSGNGISSTLDFSRYRFLNVDLSVHLSRMPAGEWVCLDAVTSPERHGAAITDTMLRDERGPIGRAAQTLIIEERRSR